MIMMILMTQEQPAAIGKDREEIKTGDTGMNKMMIMAIQEEALAAVRAAAVVEEWATKAKIGEQVVMRAAVAKIQDPGVPLTMKVEIAVHPATKVQIGARAAIRAATAVDIQMTRITWEEAGVNPVVLKTKVEETSPAQAGAVRPDHFQTDVAVAVAIGNK